MKLTITLVSLLMIAASPVVAEEAGVPNTPTAPDLDSFNRAVDVCARAFYARMFPGQKIKFHTEPTIEIKKAEAAGNLDNMTISMQARLQRDNSRLTAKGSCTVNRHLRVQNISVRMTPAAKLARLAPYDMQLVMVSDAQQVMARR